MKVSFVDSEDILRVKQYMPYREVGFNLIGGETSNNGYLCGTEFPKEQTLLMTIVEGESCIE